jgi:hypothetical protein
LRKVISQQKHIYNDHNTNDIERDDINDQLLILMKEIKDIIKDKIGNMNDIPKEEKKHLISVAAKDYADEIGMPNVIVDKVINKSYIPPPPPLPDFKIESAEEKQARIEKSKQERERKSKMKEFENEKEKEYNKRQSLMSELIAAQKAKEEKRLKQERELEELKRKQDEDFLEKEFVEASKDILSVLDSEFDDNEPIVVVSEFDDYDDPIVVISDSDDENILSGKLLEEMHKKRGRPSNKEKHALGKVFLDPSTGEMLTEF